MPSTATLRLHLLGKPELWLDQEPIKLKTKKALALLAYLAISKRPLRRGAIVGLFWGDVPEQNARASLRVLLHELPKPLSERLTISAEEIALSSTHPLQIDVDEVLQDPTHYVGDFLEGFQLNDAPEFDIWVTQHRQRIRMRVLARLDRLIEEASQASEFKQAIAYAQHSLEIEPWRESSHRALMHVLALSGDRVAALAQFKRCQQALQTEFEVAPMPETLALYQQILVNQLPLVQPVVRLSLSKPRASESVQQPAPIPPITPALIGSDQQSTRSNLPVVPNLFIGRQYELAQLAQLFGQAYPRLITVIGVGGVGKTRLLLQAGQQQQHNFADGVWWIELAPLPQTASEAQIAQAVVETLNSFSVAGQSAQSALIEHLRLKECLLILDNCEHLVAACAQLADSLLRHCPRLKLCASSREALNITGEQRLELLPWLSAPSASTLAANGERAIAETELDLAMQLFAERTRQVWLGFTVTEQLAPIIAQICRRLDGLPLAIELAAARMRLLTPQKLLEQLQQNEAVVPILVGNTRTSHSRQQTLRDTIDWSYNLLRPEERTLFRRLAVFAGSASFAQICQVCADTANDGTESETLASQTLALLESLLDKSLILRRTLAEEWRVDLLMTIRQYALEMLVASGEYEELRRRHLRAYLRLANQGAPYLGSFGQIVWLDRFDWEHDNFKHALDWAFVDQALADGIHLLSALCNFWFIRSYWGEGLHWAQLAVQAIEKSTPAWKPAHLARVYFIAGLFFPRGEVSIAYLEKAWAGYRGLGDEEKAAITLQWLLHTHLLLRNFSTIPALAQALEELTERVKHPLVLITLGRVAFVNGNLARAQAWFAEAEQLARHQQSQVGWVYAVSMNGLTLLGNVEGDQVERDLSEALAQSRLLGRKDLMMYLLGGLSELALLRDDSLRVWQLASEALPLARELNHQTSIATHFLHCACILHQQYEPEALALVALAQTLFQALTTPPEHLSAAAYERALTQTQTRLGEAVFATALATPAVFTSEQGVAFIIDNAITRPA